MPSFSSSLAESLPIEAHGHSDPVDEGIVTWLLDILIPLETRSFEITLTDTGVILFQFVKNGWSFYQRAVKDTCVIEIELRGN